MRTVDRIKRALRGATSFTQPPATAISAGYRVLEEGERPALSGWQDAAVAERQHQAFIPLLKELRSGHPRLDFVVAAQAISASKVTNPLVIEVGCGSGYYSEALPSLLAQPITYLGVDYSERMTALARRLYPAVPFVTADACRLPFEANCSDILLSGTSLMHIADYRIAIAESVRVSRSWCIFHTVPVMAERPTTLLTKEAYGEKVIEVIFNRSEMEAMFEEYGLVPEEVFESIPYDVRAVVGERTWTLTYLCRKR